MKPQLSSAPQHPQIQTGHRIHLNVPSSSEHRSSTRTRPQSLLHPQPLRTLGTLCALSNHTDDQAA